MPRRWGDTHPDDDPVHRAERDELRSSMRDALSAIPKDQADAILAVFLDGASYREAADEFGATENAIQGRLARGRAALRAILARFHHETARAEELPKLSRRRTGSDKFDALERMKQAAGALAAQRTKKAMARKWLADEAAGRVEELARTVRSEARQADHLPTLARLHARVQDLIHHVGASELVASWLADATNLDPGIIAGLTAMKQCA